MENLDIGLRITRKKERDKKIETIVKVSCKYDKAC